MAPLMLLCVLLAVELHYSAGETEGIVQPLEDAEKKECVDKHNELRRSSELFASDMKRMEWNNEAAETAAAWAKRCLWEHSDPMERTISTCGCGENLFKASFRFIWSQAIQAWYNEIKNFKYGVGKTKEDAVVGHFTQVVWSNSSQLGCAMSDCGTFYLGVCHYCPAGNIEPRTATPYSEGEPCSKCPKYCEDGLCTNACVYEDVYMNCPSLGCRLYANKCPATCKCN